MNADQEYKKTKEQTDELVKGLCEFYSKKQNRDITSVEMPLYAPVDYLIFRDGQPFFYLEVKVRSHSFRYYKNEKVPVSKYCFAYTYKNKFKMPSALLVKWSDKVGLVDMNKCSGIDVMVARYDRGEQKDIYAFYEYDDFKLLNI